MIMILYISTHLVEETYSNVSIIALENRLTPSLCEASLDYGKQTLRSGKEIFCDGKWTVSF